MTISARPVYNGLMVRVDAVLNSWKAVREDTALAVEEFPAAELDFKPTAELDSFRTIARHILEAGNFLSGALVDNESDLAVPGWRDKLKHHLSKLPQDADAAALAASLRSELDTRIAELSAKPAEFWGEIMTRFDGEKITRLEMLQFIKEHELTHRSQMFLYLRLKGIVPVTTRRRQAAQKSA